MLDGERLLLTQGLGEKVSMVSFMLMCAVAAMDVEWTIS
jgi:hypothetical protein